MYKKPKELLKNIQQKRLMRKSAFLKKLEKSQQREPKLTIDDLKRIHAPKSLFAQHFNCLSTVKPLPPGRYSMTDNGDGTGLVVHEGVVYNIKTRSVRS